MKKEWIPESELALKAISESVEIIQSSSNTNDFIKSKESYRDIVTYVDVLVEKRIRLVLNVTGYKILGEETADRITDNIFSCGPTWVIDPIDGTANFVSSIPFYSTSVGLMEKEEFILGAVVVPEFKELFFTIGSDNAYLNGRLLKSGNASMKNSLIAAGFSGKAYAPEKRQIEYELFGTINDHSRGCLRLGSAAINICYVASGRLQAAYGIANKIWDVAGAIAIARCAGCEIYFEHISNTHMVNYVVGLHGVTNKIAEIVQSKQLANFQLISSE